MRPAERANIDLRHANPQPFDTSASQVSFVALSLENRAREIITQLLLAPRNWAEIPALAQAQILGN
jgi:hypothetical protein